MSLKDDLQEINGVGEATAESILEVVNSHTVDQDAIDDALEALDKGRPDMARSYLEAAE